MTRVIYIDPGTHWNAWLVTEGQRLPIGYVDSDTIEIGNLVPRPVHKVEARLHKDGSPILDDAGNPTYLDQTRVVTDEQRSALADELIAIALRYGVTRAVVETSGAAWNMGRAEQLRQLGMIESLIFDRLRAAKIEIVKVAAVTWRARMRPLLPAPVVGSPVRGRGTELLPILAIGFLGKWGGKKDHERDCGGMAIWDTLPPLPGAKRKASGPRKPRGATREKRAARGSRARGAMGEIDLDKARSADRRRRDAKRPVACTCREVVEGKRRVGRCIASCPAHVAKPAPPPLCRGCYRPVEGHRLPLCQA